MISVNRVGKSKVAEMLRSESTTPNNTQIAAIGTKLLLGRQLQNEHPEILEMYGNGNTCTQIADALDIAKSKNVTKLIARDAVGYALKGNKSTNIGVPAYTGLADLEEHAKLRREHYKDSTEKQKAKKSGIFSLTREQLQSNSKSKIGSRYSMHKPVWKDGKIPWAKAVEERKSELDYAIEISTSPDYQHSGDRHNGMPDWKRITVRINEIFHQGKQVRTVGNIRTSVNNFIRLGKRT